MGRAILDGKYFGKIPVAQQIKLNRRVFFFIGGVRELLREADGISSRVLEGDQHPAELWGWVGSAGVGKTGWELELEGLGTAWEAFEPSLVWDLGSWGRARDAVGLWRWDGMGWD